MADTFDFDALKVANRLPSPSGTALKIMEMLAQENTAIENIATLVQTDPALSARVLQFVNSSVFASQKPITDISQAITKIGLNVLKNFALSLSLINSGALSTFNRCHGFGYAAFWSYSLARAVALMVLNRNQRVMAPEEAFTIGLLIDIGRLAFASVWPDEFSHCLHTASDEKDLKQQEINQFSITHNQLTLLLLKDWHFASESITAIEYCFKLKEGKNSLSEQIMFAQLLAHYCLAQIPEKRTLHEKIRLNAPRVNYAPSDIDTLIEAILTQWKEWGRLIDVKTDVPYSKLFVIKTIIESRL